MTTTAIDPYEITGITEFIDVLNVSTEEIVAACKAENLLTEFITVHNDYYIDNKHEAIQSLDELSKEQLVELTREVLPGQEYAFMDRVLEARPELYFCEPGDEQKPYKFLPARKIVES